MLDARPDRAWRTGLSLELAYTQVLPRDLGIWQPPNGFRETAMGRVAHEAAVGLDDAAARVLWWWRVVSAILLWGCGGSEEQGGCVHSAACPGDLI